MVDSPSNENNNHQELLAQLDNKRSITSWALYDWANSAFATTVMAGFFPTFFRSFWADPEITSLITTEITFYWGLANSIEAVIILILAPILGAIADRMSGKKKFLAFFALLGILSTGALWFIQQGAWIGALILYVLGAMGFSGANIFYDGLLPGVASEKKIDYVSSLGYSLGYIGGGLLFAGNVVMFMFMDDSVLAVKLSFVSVAVWWALFSIPLFIIVKEPIFFERVSLNRAVKLGFQQLWHTLLKIRHLKYVGLFLAAYWFYIDGVDTIIRMAVDYGGALGFPTEIMIAALLLTQFVAFPGTLLFNKFAKKIGVKKGILVAIGAYSLITLLGVFMSVQWHFFALACLIGLFQGGIQALSRSLYSRLIPVNKSAEFYGFFNMLGKFAAILGPLLIGVVGLITDNPRIGILSILILFISGGLILWRVDIKAGEQMARDHLFQI